MREAHLTDTQKKRIQNLYATLRKTYGHPAGQWQLWCKRNKTIHERELVCIESILTQRTNWRNVELAIEQLRRSGFSSLWKMMRRFSNKPTDLYPLIRPCGFFRAKARYLLVLARFIESAGGIKKLLRADVHWLRTRLLRLAGIGPETADSILLYGLDKPVFVIDEYTRRLVKQERITDVVLYEHLRKLFEASMRRNFRLYQDFHALIVIYGKHR